MKAKLSKEVKHCVPGARLWIYSSRSASTTQTRCWSFQVSEERHHCALDMKAA